MNLQEQRPALAARVRLQVDTISGDPVLLYPEGVLVLNDTAYAVVQKCNGANAVSAIVDSLNQEYEIDRADLERDVCACVNDLLARNLLVLQA